MANYLNKILKAKDEMLMDGKVWRKVADFPNYYVSDTAEVLSTTGNWKLLAGTSVVLCRPDRYQYNQVSRRYEVVAPRASKSISKLKLCVQAFDDVED